MVEVLYTHPKISIANLIRQVILKFYRRSPRGSKQYMNKYLLIFYLLILALVIRTQAYIF